MTGRKHEQEEDSWDTKRTRTKTRTTYMTKTRRRKRKTRRNILRKRISKAIAGSVGLEGPGPPV
mgnify:CR=1 FL=1